MNALRGDILLFERHANGPPLGPDLSYHAAFMACVLWYLLINTAGLNKGAANILRSAWHSCWIAL